MFIMPIFDHKDLLPPFSQRPPFIITATQYFVQATIFQRVHNGYPVFINNGKLAILLFLL